MCRTTRLTLLISVLLISLVPGESESDRQIPPSQSPSPSNGLDSGGGENSGGERGEKDEPDQAPSNLPCRDLLERGVTISSTMSCRDSNNMTECLSNGRTVGWNAGQPSNRPGKAQVSPTTNAHWRLNGPPDPEHRGLTEFSDYEGKGYLKSLRKDLRSYKDRLERAIGRLENARDIKRRGIPGKPGSPSWKVEKENWANKVKV
ncbi:hypothetical protein RHMOL_Rhmol03G0176600 [Rhododendron molle]|uniref:Uncharacterized protein n=1 Tax=Rhododendron molle TaxID=49168 RepID=A0ACC0PG01_RHOML|nr:hypothetical protein RHMOL_Rhmol03G0176600 [Rhododendron molle]